MRTVFLSSTGADLHAYRTAAFLAIQKLDGWKCVCMEDFGARDEDVDTFCRECVRNCHLFVGVIGHRFGAGPKGSNESYTHREYRAACEAGKPRLLFLVPDDFPIPANLFESTSKIKAQAKFREKLRCSGDRIVSIGFTTPDQLAREIVTAVYHFVQNLFGGLKKFDTAGYLNSIWEDTAYIDIRGLKVAGEAVHRFRIDQLYAPLTTVLANRESKLEPGEQRAVPLQNALENKRMVLVGDPGAGKSTFLRRIAFAACETLLGRNPLAGEELLPSPCPFPLFVRADSLSNHILQDRRCAGCPPDAHSPAWLVHYLEAAERRDDRTLRAAFFHDQLDRGCLLLLDGLDEVADRTDSKAIARPCSNSQRARIRGLRWWPPVGRRPMAARR